LERFTVEILTVGNELLIGKICNTNAQWLAQRITRLGGMVRRIITVPDSLPDIVQALRDCLSRKPDFVLTVGGLGPTFDDMTLQGVSEALGRPLKLHREALRMVEEKVEEMKAQGILKKPWLTPEREKMATLPEGAEPLYNPEGTAPGVKLQAGETLIICLPGVPVEMKAIFDLHLEKLMAERSKLKYAERGLFVEGIPEPDFSPSIDEAMKRHPEVYVKSHPKGGEATSKIELHISAFAPTLEEAERRVEAAASWLEAEARRLGGRVERLG